MTSVVPIKALNRRGFNPCGMFLSNSISARRVLPQPVQPARKSNANSTERANADPWVRVRASFHFRWLGYAAFFTFMLTRSPAAMAIFISMSRPKELILPHIRLEMRG